MDISRLVASQGRVAYLARASLHDAKSTLMAKKYLQKAFAIQMRGLGFTLVELLSSCPTCWKISPPDALRYMEGTMVPAFPLGEFVDVTADVEVPA